MSWRNRWLSLRDRLISNPRFQQWATAFPLTRPIARRRTRALFDIVAGFVYAQVLLACVELRLFDILAAGPLTVDALSRRIALPREATLRLLKAAASLDLLTERGSAGFGLGSLGAAMVGNAGISAMVEHHRMLYADLRDPVALLRAERGGATELSRYWPYARTDAPSSLAASEINAYTALMATSQRFIAEEVLAAYPVRRHRCLLDIGGGDAAFLTAAAARAPLLRLQLFDLPAVTAGAARTLAAAGLDARAEAFGGDFRRDSLPAGADLVSLIRIVHDHDDDAALGILRAAWQALAADGTLLVAEPMSGTSGAEPAGDAYFGFYLLAMGSGRPRTRTELADLLRRAGFDRIKSVPTRNPLLTGLLLGRKPA